MIWKGKEVRYRTDLILGTYRRLFGNDSVRDPQHNSDHYMVLGCLPSASLTEHKRYLGGEEAVTGEAAGETNTGRSTFRGPTEGRPIY